MVTKREQDRKEEQREALLTHHALMERFETAAVQRLVQEKVGAGKVGSEELELLERTYWRQFSATPAAAHLTSFYDRFGPDLSSLTFSTRSSQTTQHRSGLSGLAAVRSY